MARREGLRICKCECGGEVRGIHSMGRLFTWCEKCTPVVMITAPGVEPKISESLIEQTPLVRGMCAEIERLQDKVANREMLHGMQDAEIERLTSALEDIALLDECDGHELAVRHAFEAVAIATKTLGKHPSEIAAARLMPRADVHPPEPDALGYATRLAGSLWEKHFKQDAPDWRPLPDLLGVLTQIDNMTTGLVRGP